MNAAACRDRDAWSNAWRMRRTRGEMVRLRVLVERGLVAELFPGVFRRTAFLFGGLAWLALLAAAVS